VDAPQRFARAAEEAFEFLGFEASSPEGAREAEILLSAHVSPEESYTVLLVCVAGPDGGVEVDRAALDERAGERGADFVTVLAPSFSDGGGADREEPALLLDAGALGALLRRHARVPLDLAAYRHLFEGRTVDASAALLADLTRETERHLRLSARIVQVVSRVTPEEGALRPRDLYWLLREYEDELGEYTEAEIEQALAALSSPALRAIRQDRDGCLGLGSAATASRRLQLIARLIEEGDRA